MLEVRRITPEEVLMTQRIESIVFNFKLDPAKQGEPDKLDNPAQWKWAAFQDGEMTSSLAEIPYSMRFDGHSVPMSGIGGVGTLPQARKGGMVRRILERLLPEAYEKGVIFSNLTPFSHSFYRMFGYELCCARNHISIPTREFSGQRLRGEFKPFLPGDDLSVLKDIHTRYIADINHAIERDCWADDRMWRQFTKGDPNKDGVFLYVWYGEGGDPRAYIQYKYQRVKDENRMEIGEIAFLDRDALYGALSIVGVLGSQYDTFRWMMPTFIDPADLVEGIWEVKQTIVPRDMTRVVNVKASLELMRRPEGEGEYTLEVLDPLIGANQGRYLVQYGPEGTHVSATARPADLICDIPSLSQLITGYRTLGSALLTRRQGLELQGNGETLARVFTLRPQQITEAF